MTHRILLADDSATIRKVVELTFSDEDFSIDSVGDGSQAFEHARAQRPDIIISDVAMPGLNGYELCKRVKSDPDLQAVPFLFLKGAFESFDEEQARSSGSDGFIVKPFESQEMIAKVKDLIGKVATAAPSAAPLPVANLRAPIPAESRPAAVQEVPAFPPAEPATVSPAPQPLPQQRTATPPPVPAPPAVTARPAPPIPAWPTRPVPVAPQLAPPPRPIAPLQQPTPPPLPPVYQPPPPPVYQPPVYQPPPPPAAAQAPTDDFNFDFGDADDNRFGTPAPQPAVNRDAAPPQEASGESDEDLWSEVSLRGTTSDLLEDRGQNGSGVESGADIVDLTEEAAIIAPEVLFEDEVVFEEVSTARRLPLESIAEPPAAPVEPPVTTASVPPPSPPSSAPAPATATPVALDQAEIERLVSSSVEAAVRRVLEPIVGDLARATIDSIAWEVIPDLAEAMIRAEIERVRQSTRTD